jgi:hypothetical protein
MTKGRPVGTREAIVLLRKFTFSFIFFNSNDPWRSDTSIMDMSMGLRKMEYEKDGI